MSYDPRAPDYVSAREECAHLLERLDARNIGPEDTYLWVERIREKISEEQKITGSVIRTVS